MSELGFWKLATAHPDRTALVTPDGERIKAGELLARSNQLVHGLRKLGLAAGRRRRDAAPERRRR